ncbi:MAG: ATP-binding protein [Spirochaetaceae bacterium]|nr:ATP-binding protein [Spirochaetaceae bacterium]
MGLRAKFILLLILLNGLILVFCLAFYLNINRGNIIRHEISIIDAVKTALLEEKIAVRGMFIFPVSSQVAIMENAERNLDQNIADLLTITYLTNLSPIIDNSIRDIITERYASRMAASELYNVTDRIIVGVGSTIRATANLEMINQYAIINNNAMLRERTQEFSDLLFDIERNIENALANFDLQYQTIADERVTIERNAIITFIIFFLTITLLSITAGWLIARSIINVTHSLDRASKEIDVVFKNIHEGIFHLDESLKIGSLCSKHFEDLFRNIDFKNIYFKEFLRDIGVSAKDILVTDDYLNLFFDDKINPSLLSQANPLDKVHISIIGENKKVQEKYLSFIFSMFTSSSNEKAILGTVKDITEEVLYAEALKEEEEKSREKMEHLVQIMNIEPPIMEEFLEDSQDEIDYINNLLKSNRPDYRRVVNEIYLAIHSVKGNAQLLGLKNISNLLNRIETNIKDLLETREIKWENVLESTIQLGTTQENLDDLKTRVKELMTYQSKFKNLQEKTGLFERTLNKILVTEGIKEGKILNLDCANFNSKNVPKEHRKIVKDIFMQMARNTIHHGIEKPDEREKRGKLPQGTVHISLKKDTAGNIIYSFKDDGNGIDAEKIAKMAQKKGLAKAGTVMDLSEAVKLIFNMGFSTAEEDSVLAGRGIGLNLIREKISSANGKIKIRTEKGKYCEYIIFLPYKPAE